MTEKCINTGNWIEMCEFLDEVTRKEAKLAWANDEKIEYTSEDLGDWIDLTHANTLGVFDRPDFKFRRKPKTITINGIEVPAPFEPKEDDRVWVIDLHRDCGYGPLFFNSTEPEYTQFGAWRTEEEIKQIVAALRQVFGVCDD